MAVRGRRASDTVTVTCPVSLVWLVLAMALFSGQAYEEVARLLSGWPEVLRGEGGALTK